MNDAIMTKDARARQIRSEIEWLKDQLKTKKLTQKNFKTYEHQIKERELNLAALFW